MAENKTKMRAGDIRVVLEEEEVLWVDRKRVTIFALPWSFTKYSLTPSRLILEKGFIKRREDEVRLYRVKDMVLTQTFIERLNNTGTIQVVSSDASVPMLELKHIKRARKVKDVLSQTVEVCRRAHGVRTSELMGGPLGASGEDSGAFGPEMGVDMNMNGVDDRLE